MDEKIIPFERRVLLSMSCLRVLRWPLDVEDVRKFPEGIQPHGGVVCREAARRLSSNKERHWRQNVHRSQTRARQTAELRRERTAAMMRERYALGARLRRRIA